MYHLQNQKHRTNLAIYKLMGKLGPLAFHYGQDLPKWCYGWTIPSTDPVLFHRAIGVDGLT